MDTTVLRSKVENITPTLPKPSIVKSKNAKTLIKPIGEMPPNKKN